MNDIAPPSSALTAPLRATKILATLGPSSSGIETVRQLVQAGASGFRLNFSHGTFDDHKARAETVRAVAAETGLPLTVLMDLQGPKIRVGEMSAPVLLVAGQPLVLDLDPTPGDGLRVSLPHPEILNSLQTGDTVLVNDGVIGLRVTAKDANRVVTVIETAGVLSSRKGVNVPGRTLPMSALTNKDRRDLAQGLELGVDWVALSFVQTAADVEEARALMNQHASQREGARARIMVKIETQASIENLAGILAAADGLMVARGDLGVELPTEDVPPLQKTMIQLCRAVGKPVVVATQMLESMIQNPRPTRAEASDVANAVYDGADCVMLSAESASGAYPVEAVATMDRIIRKVEAAFPEPNGGVPAMLQESVAEATAAAGIRLAQGVNAAAVVTFTESGQTALRVSRQRARQSEGTLGMPLRPLPIVALTPHRQVACQLGIVWGVRGVVCAGLSDVEGMVAMARQLSHDSGLVADGGMLVVLAGIPFGAPGSTNMVRVVNV